MPRPLKHTIDYFPHFVNSGKTLLILQNEFGNDGYAFWFKLLSLLCKSDGQVYDYNNTASWRLLLAETSVSEDIANKILQLLADIEAIDPALYQSKIIWVQHLVDNLSDVYTRRRNGFIPEKPVIANINTPPMPHMWLKPDQTIPDQTIPDKTNNSAKKESLSQRFETFWKAYPKRKSKGQAEKAFMKVNPNEELLAIILAAIKRAIKSIDWQKDDGKFIPYPATWLNARGWEDEFHERGGQKVRRPGRLPSDEELDQQAVDKGV